MARSRFKLDRVAVERLVDGDIGRAAVKRAGEKVEAAARAAVSGLDVEDDSDPVPVPIAGGPASDGSSRYLVGIPHPAGMAVEAKHRPLGSALDAAR